jgi:hypothetical protein
MLYVFVDISWSREEVAFLECTHTILRAAAMG